MLIVEDGVGRADAESLASVAAADAHHAARGNVSWDGAMTADKESALRRATDYMSIYRAKWKGRRMSTVQALDWPRYGVDLDDVGCNVPSNVVPKEVVQACCDLAFRTLDGSPLAPDLERQVAAETVGPIKTEYAQGVPQHVRYRAVDLLLKPLLSGGGGMGIQMVRA